MRLRSYSINSGKQQVAFISGLGVLTHDITLYNSNPMKSESAFFLVPNPHQDIQIKNTRCCSLLFPSFAYCAGTWIQILEPK